jgi:hypothetical protein
VQSFSLGIVNSYGLCTDYTVVRSYLINRPSYVRISGVVLLPFIAQSIVLKRFVWHIHCLIHIYVDDLYSKIKLYCIFLVTL